MKTALQLREEIAELCDRVDTIVNGARAAARDLNGSEVEEVDRIQGRGKPDAQNYLRGRVEVLQEQLDLAERLEAREHARASAHANGGMAMPAGELTVQTGEPHSRRRGGESARSGFSFRDQTTGRIVRALAPGERLYTPREGAPSIGQFVTAMLMNNVYGTPMRNFYNAVGQTGGQEDQGGYLLNPELSQQVIDLARDASVMIRAGAQTFPMPKGEVHLARVSADPVHYWRGEGVQVPASNVAFEKILLRAKTCAAIVPISIELLEDAANAAEIIENCLTKSLGLALDQAGLLGDGVTGPRGIANQQYVNTLTNVGTPTDYSHVTASISKVLQANYAGDVADLAWVQHPRDAQTYDALKATTGQPLRQTPWVSKTKQLYTTSFPIDGSGNTQSIVGHFPQCLIGTRTDGIVLRVLDSGSVTDILGNTINATNQLYRLLVAYLRADIALMHPTFFTVMSGITNT